MATSPTPTTTEVKKHQQGGVGGEKTTTQQAAPTTAGGGGGAEEKKVTAAKDYLLQYYHHRGCVCQGTSGTDSDKKKTLKLFVDKNDDSKRTFTFVEDEDSSTDDGAWGHVDTYTGTWCGKSSGTEQKNLKLQVDLPGSAVLTRPNRRRASWTRAVTMMTLTCKFRKHKHRVTKQQEEVFLNSLCCFVATPSNRTLGREMESSSPG